MSFLPFLWRVATIKVNGQTHTFATKAQVNNFWKEYQK